MVITKVKALSHCDQCIFVHFLIGISIGFGRAVFFLHFFLSFNFFIF